MSAELRAMLRDQVRAAIEGRPEVLALFNAYDALASAPPSSAIAASEKAEPVRLVSQAELCQLFDIKARTVQVMTQDGRIPPEAVIRAGRSVRYDVALVIEALRGRRSSAAAWGARVGASMRVIDGGAK